MIYDCCQKRLIFARFVDSLCILCTKPLSDHYCALSENSLCSVCTPMVSLQSTVLFFTISGIVLYASCGTKDASLGFVLTVVHYYYFLWHKSWQTHILNYHIYMKVRWPWQWNVLPPSPSWIFSFWEYSCIDFSQVVMLYSICMLNIFWNEVNIRVKKLEYYCSKKLLTPHW